MLVGETNTQNREWRLTWFAYSPATQLALIIAAVAAVALFVWRNDAVAAHCAASSWALAFQNALI